MKTITLAGREFTLRDEPPKQGRLMVLARTEARGSAAEKMAAYLDLLEAMLTDDVDRAEFEDAICDMDAEEIGEAIEEAAKGYKVDPSSARRERSSGSSDGSQTDSPTSRVVSLSRGTVEVEEMPASSTG